MKLTIVIWIRKVLDGTLSPDVVYAADRCDDAEYAEPEYSDQLVFLTPAHAKAQDGRYGEAKYSNVEEEIEN